MAVYLPTRPISIPSSLAGQTNGRLDSRILWSTPGQDGGSTVILVDVAARAWRSLCADAKRHGHILKITGSASAYRTYAWQYKMFTERYVTWNTGSGVSVIWGGRRWWKRQGVPITAVPGTSNHGWGLAVDTGEERDSDFSAESLDSGTLRWLIDNEHRFGFSHELQSEPWHIRYWAGDNIPAAVLEYETNRPQSPATEEEDMTPEQAQTLNEVHWMLGQVKPNTDRLPAVQGSLDQVNWGVLDPEDGLRTAVAELSNRVAELEKQLAAQVAT